MKTLLTFFKRTPTFDSAIKSVTIAAEKLADLVAYEQAEIERLDVVITETATARLDAFGRRDRALTVAKRFQDLVA